MRGDGALGREHPDALARLLCGAERAIAFTGAGISTESGIPDFRSPSGLWTRFDPNEFTFQNYLRNPEHRRRIWQMRCEFHEEVFRPNPAHQALADLERLGVLDAVITQNIDGLHQDAGNETVLELHGNGHVVACLGCGDRQPTVAVLERVRAGEEDPPCTRCGGILKTTTIAFGEAMPAEVLADAYLRAAAADVCLVVGSSLAVYPAADVPLEAARSGARLAIVNAEPTPADGIAEVVVHARCGEVLPPAADAVRALIGSGGPDRGPAESR